MSSATATRVSAGGATLDPRWQERAARFYEDMWPPARAMIRRAFRRTFSDEEIEDIYANAWLGTLRALAPRHAGLGDEEIRSYVLTAVAHQASKELRRRGRKPTTPLENAGPVIDSAPAPEEHVTQRESSAVMRDLLASIPRRRRAVLMLRYGWGLEPAQVCELIDGLSPRAYRKEITRGIDDLTDRMRRLERGEWCSDREPILKLFAAGTADAEERRQAEHHLAHCRHCADFVGRLTGHLHDLGGGAAPIAIDALDDGHLGLADRIGDVVDRVRSLPATLHRGETATGGVAGQASATGGLRGGGATGAGVVAKLTGMGAAGKFAVACVSGGVAVSCVAAGVGPVHFPLPEPTTAVHVQTHHANRYEVTSVAPPDVLPSQVANVAEPPPPSDDGDGTDGDPPPEPEAPEPAPTTVEAAPSSETEFGLAPAPAPSGGGPDSSSSKDDSAAQEFGP